MEAIIEKDGQLLQTVKQCKRPRLKKGGVDSDCCFIFSPVREHQMLQQKILQLKAELESKDRVVVHLAAQLKQAENTLQQIIEQIATFANILPSSPRGRAAAQSHNQQGVYISKTNDHPGSCLSCSNIRLSHCVTCLAVDVESLIAYGHRLSYSTSAPVGWNPNLPHMQQFRPPAPQEHNIRAGLYYTNPPPSTPSPLLGII